MDSNGTGAVSNASQGIEDWSLEVALHRFGNITLDVTFGICGDPDNGVLARVPGELESRALRALPDPVTATEDYMQSVIDVPHLGPVRITAKRMLSKHGKTRHRFWTAIHAEIIGSGS